VWKWLEPKSKELVSRLDLRFYEKQKQKINTDIKGSLWNQEWDNTIILHTIILETTWTLWLQIGDFQTHSWKEVSNLEFILKVWT
jgi:hypothetical protein